MHCRKRLIACIVGATTFVSLTACAGGGTGAATCATPTPQATQSAETTSGNGSTTLVAYFSATGSTRHVAEEIAKVTDGALFEIEPADPYTAADLDYNDADSRVSREHDDEGLRDVKLRTTEVPNWDDYTTVYIGYPIWWGIAAWPVNTSVRGNDFNGKTVIPFCTSASSSIGSSGKDLQALTKGGDWKEGERFSSSASTADVADWVKQQS
ncbi:flavodoxin [uncultured Bifidobacterium sp.]|uniref:flavodoxin n=1 Tax=uncultured Bifidobacterium sp. TaxID=165187 RepID=UPI0025972BA7|nr:flavodoxin [uncultured Bifidobacterium sp.]